MGRRAQHHGGTCFGGDGLGLNSWAMIFCRLSITGFMQEILAQQLPSAPFLPAGVPFGDCVARDDMTLRGARPGGVQEQLCTDGDCVAARAAADIFSGRGFKESQRKISSPTMV